MMPRYIDANGLWLLIEDYLNIPLFNSDYDAGVQKVQKMIDVYPTADVEEVKHATWECTDESNNIWKCSGKDGCGEHFILYEGTPEDNNYKRCPNCGTRMDGKEKTDERDHTV